MFDEVKIAELTEKYLNGSLTDTEKELFLLMVNSNETYKLHFEQYKTLYNTFRHITLKNEISDIIFNNGSSVRTKRPRYSDIFLNYFKYSAVAAAISFLVVIGTLAGTGFFSLNQAPSDSYTLLKNTLINISKRQAIINSTQSDNNSIENYASGTCFPISTNGYFITSLHLVKNSGTAFLSRSGDTLKYTADVILKDLLHDIAIIKISDTSFTHFKTLPFSIEAKQYEIGEYVYTLGFSKNDIVFNDGSISSVTGYLEDSTSYQLSIPANPGNSGGPIISSNGEILGILLAKNPGIDNATFALKSCYVRNLIDSLVNDTTYNVIFPPKQQIKYSNKVQFIKQMQPYIYRIEVY